MTEYVILFNGEWVPPHTLEQLQEKSRRSREVIDDMAAAGVLVYANGGIDTSTAAFSVVAADGDLVFTDGPYVETKEHVGGFTVVEVPDEAAARYWAGRLAAALEWPQEVHPFGARLEVPERFRVAAGEGE